MEVAFRLLQWLAFSVRPISLDEAVEVLATDPDAAEGEPMFDPRRRLYDPRDVLKMCSSLVTLTASQDHVFDEDGDEESRIEQGFKSLSETQVIILAHFSVRDYLTSDHLRMRDERTSFYHFNKQLADTSIAKTCLAYLLEFDEDWVTRSAPQPYALLDYAARS